MFSVIAAHLRSVETWQSFNLLSDVGVDAAFTLTRNNKITREENRFETVLKLCGEKVYIDYNRINKRNGSTRSFERVYKRGKIEGLSIEKENSLAIIPYVKGKRHGLKVRYGEDGEVAGTAEFMNDEKHGKHIDYYENGEVDEIAEFKDGKLHGKLKSFYSNGKLCCQEFYNKGEPYGTHLYYYENGKLARTNYYEHGKLKRRTEYYENGQVEAIFHYWKNKQPDRETRYDEKGQIVKNTGSLRLMLLQRETH